MKRIFIALLVVCALLCFALPAVAGPPGEVPAISALGVVADYSPIMARIRAPIFGAEITRAVAPLLSVERLAIVSIYAIFAIGFVATLAGLMRGRKSRGRCLRYDPRDRMHGLARDQTASA